MNKRQKEVLQQFLDNEKEVLKKLENIYKDALAEINGKVELLLARQDADMQHVIYQVDYQKALKTQVNAILEQLHNNEFETLSEFLTGAYEDGFLGTLYDMQGQGCPLIFPIDQEQIVRAIQHETKLSEGLYAALGKDTKALSKTIASEISRGISTGAMYPEIARNIASQAKIPKNRAMNIARTEAHRIQCASTADAQWKAKEKGADVVKQWDSFLDGATRPTHRELDGQIRELDEPFKVAGKKAMYPGGFGDPAEDCNCRCALLQRARWALGNDIQKWVDGEVQTIKANDYDSFKKEYYKKLDESKSVQQSSQKIKSGKTLENPGKSSTIVSGAISGARNPLSDEAKEHAIKYYGLVRSMKTDVAKISKTTGIPEADVQKVKDFIFNEKHDLGGKELEYFEPDYMMAESWQRLIAGKPESHDITLIRHEIMERELIKQGLSQEEAHLQTSQKFNYSKEASEYYAKIKKYKNE